MSFVVVYMGLWMLLCLRQSHTKDERRKHLRGRRRDVGQGTLFANTTVYSAMILTDPKTADIMGSDHGMSAVSNAQQRRRHAEQFIKKMPFPVELWWSMYAPPCPSMKKGSSDRGVALAHYQVCRPMPDECLYFSLLILASWTDGVAAY